MQTSYSRQAPRDSGYRSVHLIYRYHSDRSETFNTLKIELQLRSRLQHAWATAVETVGTFIRQALKSSQGEEEWLRFFALMGTALAIRERTAPVPDTPTSTRQLKKELRDYARKLDVEGHLHAYQTSLRFIGMPDFDYHYYLLQLQPGGTADDPGLTVYGYDKHDLERATEDYLEVERSTDDVDAVLVSVDSLVSLQRAYPNYFLDTAVFLDAMNQAIGK